MHIIKITLFFLFALLAQSTQSFFYTTFEEFDTFCVKNLPTLQTFTHYPFKIQKNRAAFVRSIDYFKFRGVNLSEFEHTLDAFLTLMTTSLTNSTQWINGECYPDPTSPSESTHNPYAQKVLCNDNDSIALRGDMHGDIHSLLSFLRSLQAKGHTSKENGFKITNPNLKVIFLGDYVDRGIYGVEVIYTILRFKLANPEQVILIRGNHEDLMLSAQFDFNDELRHKFIDTQGNYTIRILRKLRKLYETLPLVAYVGCAENESLIHYVQCCHGGIEVGFNPQELLASPDHITYQLLGELQQITECEKLQNLVPVDSFNSLRDHCQNIRPTKPVSKEFLNGFMWSDFQHDSLAPFEFISNRGFCYSKELSEAILQIASSATHTVSGIFRAHQHVLSNDDPLMQQMLSSYGVARLWSQNNSSSFHPWPGIVCTLLLSPDNSVALKSFDFSGFDFDTTVMIRLRPKFTDWAISIINTDIYEHLSQNNHYDSNYADARRFASHSLLSAIAKSNLATYTLFTALGTYGIYKSIQTAKAHYKKNDK